MPAPLRSSAFVSRPGGAPGASAWPLPILEHPSAPQEQSVSSKVNVHDESLLLDKQNKVPRPRAQENPRSGRGVASFQPPLSLSIGRQCLPSQHAIRGSRGSVRQCSTSYSTAARRTEFYRLSRRNGSAKKGPQQQLQLTTSVEGCPHPTVAPNAFSSRTLVIRSLSPTSGSVADVWLRNGVRNTTEEMRLLWLGNGAHSLLEYFHVSCVQTPVAGV